jgi:hypothetical protein
VKFNACATAINTRKLPRGSLRNDCFDLPVTRRLKLLETIWLSPRGRSKSSVSDCCGPSGDCRTSLRTPYLTRAFAHDDKPSRPVDPLVR